MRVNQSESSARISKSQKNQASINLTCARAHLPFIQNLLCHSSPKMSVTPESDKTVSMTSQGAMGPTPKNEFKKPVHQR